MKSSEYWKERFEALEDEGYKKSQEYYKDLQEQFRIAQNSITLDIEHWYQRLADNNEISLTAAKRLLKKDELEEFHWDVQQYIKKGKDNALNQKWIKQLENASAKYHISYLEAMKLQIQQHCELLSAQYDGGLTEFLHKTYEDRFYHSACEIQKGVGVGWNLAKLDTNKIDKIITTPWAMDGKNFSERIWTNKEKMVRELHTELTQSLIRGEDPQKAINRLSKKMCVSKDSAGRLIMTESAAISAMSQKDCYKELGVEEFEFVATLDSLTSEICRDMDGQHFKMSDYEIGVNAPPLHCWCRSCTVPYFDDEFTVNEKRAARGEDGKTYYVDSNIKYNDWYETYVDNKIEKSYNDLKMKMHFPDEIMKIRGVTPDVKKQLDSAITKLMEEYDIRIDVLSIEPADKGDLFVAGWFNSKMGLVVNENMDFERVIKRMASKYKSGYMAGKSLEDYIAHEMFHIMTYQDCKTEFAYRAKYTQIESLYEQLKGISGYADSCQSGNEALAEAFVRIRNGENVPLLAKVLVESYVGRWRK